MVWKRQLQLCRRVARQSTIAAVTSETTINYDNNDRLVADSYDNNGNTIESQGRKYRYAGEQWDADLGLYYNCTRYLDVDQGRFWTSDSFEGEVKDPLSLHKYLYGNANPVGNVDPSGSIKLSVVGISLGVSLIITAFATFQLLPAGIGKSFPIPGKVERIERHMIEKLNGLPLGGNTFAIVSQFAADEFSEVEWQEHGIVDAQLLFIGILQDIFLADDYLRYPFGLLREKSPRKVSIPSWIKEHKDNSGDWFEHPGDLKGEKYLLGPTGRRDHFLINVTFRPFVGRKIIQFVHDSLVGEEKSIGDLTTNDLGAQFGYGVLSNSIKKSEIGQWIRNHLVEGKHRAN
jgi:RHS repeat-associated protein